MLPRPAARPAPRKKRSKRSPRSVGHAAPAAHAGTHPGGEPLTVAPELVDALREWRLEEARRRAIAPFIVLHDRTLHAIAATRPQSVLELQRIPGIGPSKLAEYGEAIVAVLAGAGHGRDGQ